MKAGIVFDLDDTLIDRHDILAAYAARLWSDFGVAKDAPLRPFVESFLTLEDDGRASPEDWSARLAAALPRSSLASADIVRHFARHAWSEPKLVPAVAAALSRLRAKGVPLGIITNGDALGQRRKLESTGLDRLVDHCIVSGEFGADKPDPSIFDAMCEALELDAARSWFIGDNPVCDVWGAHRAGFRTVWLQKRIAWPDDYERCHTHVASSIEVALGIVAGAD